MSTFIIQWICRKKISVGVEKATNKNKGNKSELKKSGKS